MAPNTLHMHSHTHGLQDHPWELTWPCPLPLSAGVCPEQTGPLSVGSGGGLRPRCSAGAEGAAACQWSVAAGASGNGVTLTLNSPILTPASFWVQDPSGEVEKRAALLHLSSWTGGHGWAHSGYRPSERRARPPDVSMKSLCKHGSTQSSSSSMWSLQKQKSWDFLRFNQGQSDDRKRSVTSTGLRLKLKLPSIPKKYRESSGVKNWLATEKKIKTLLIKGNCKEIPSLNFCYWIANDSMWSTEHIIIKTMSRDHCERQVQILSISLLKKIGLYMITAN